MASVLTRTLLETNQKIPDFLQMYIPEGEARENIKFEADSDFDPNDIAGAGDAGGAWGQDDDAAAAAGDGDGNAWTGVASGDNQEADSWNNTSTSNAVW